MKTLSDLYTLLEQTSKDAGLRIVFPSIDHLTEKLRCFRVGKEWVNHNYTKEEIASLDMAEIKERAAAIDEKFVKRYAYIREFIEENDDDLEAMNGLSLSRHEWTFIANMLLGFVQEYTRGSYPVLEQNAIEARDMKIRFAKAAVYARLADTVYGWALEAQEIC